MNWRQDCADRIAAAIVSWPVELCRMVAELAVDKVRWSDGNDHIDRSADGLTGRIAGDFRSFEQSIADRFGSLNYFRIVAEKSLSNTETDWTIQFQANGYYARIGVVALDGKPLITTPKILFWFNCIDLEFGEDSTRCHTLQKNSMDFRFGISVDLRTGTLSIRVWSVDAGLTASRMAPADVFDWFSTSISPVLLAGSKPVVYLRGTASSVRLVADDDDANPTGR